MERLDHHIGAYGAEGSTAVGEWWAFWGRFVDRVVTRCGRSR
jgi:hypothetical protein